MMEVISACMVGIKLRPFACEGMYRFVRVMGYEGLLKINRVLRYMDISMEICIFVTFSQEWIML